MGDPVRIVDLAENMIRLSGQEPGHDVAIEFIGARPGEKLHEELWTDDETIEPSPHPAILKVTRPAIDPEWLDASLAELERLVEEGATLDAVACLSAMVREPRRETGAVTADARSTAPAETV